MKLRLALALLLSTAAAPALADPAPSVPQRVDKLEKEMKAVQRKVFPGGSPAFFEPEIQAPQAAPQSAGSPAGAPLNELTGRVDALEKALSQTTAQNEELQHRLQIVSEQAARDRSEFDTRLKALEANAAPPAPAPVADAAPIKPRGKPAKLVPADADAPVPDAKPVKAIATDKPAKPVKEDTAPVSANGDPAEDAYMAGYKLWADKKYADAEVTLADVAKKYPKHKRASYARNLLGRAQLDEGKPATAAQTFLANYQSDPHGERAPDSLFYLGVSLTQLKKTDNACRAFGELEDVYGATMSDGIKAKLPAAKKAAACK
ncbi:TolA-binding protein [Sphingomonas vulcanisoli]|uniref:TolA-binding protein n=1 Tax=Sphingomonas vulcanisoli TaxID=1658060 RepID=A0ABX0TR07_9SPHN|nr:tetratricopeptide repeat protein [Sphingomonas vulcanisoli]NIJ06574.1 TolA-binding protein [Sphingomonas vulcanisoli]